MTYMENMTDENTFSMSCRVILVTIQYKTIQCRPVETDWKSQNLLTFRFLENTDHRIRTKRYMAN